MATVRLVQQWDTAARVRIRIVLGRARFREDGHSPDMNDARKSSPDIPNPTAWLSCSVWFQLTNV